MKLILDFDDTLSNNKPLKEAMYSCLEEVGIPRNVSEKFYNEKRSTSKPFSLKDFLRSIFANENIEGPVDAVYEKIMEICPNLLDQRLLDIVKKLGKENCYIVTNGDFDYQMDKIKRSNIETLFSRIIVVPGSKKEAIEKICTDNKDERIIFVDNKPEFFADLDMSVCKNLTTILYDENSLERLKIIYRQNL